MSAVRSPIFLHVERMVLSGMPLTGAQAARIQGTMERELGRLFAARGNLAWRGAGTVVPTAKAPKVYWDAKHPERLGRALARSVFASFGGSSLERGTRGNR